MTVSDGLRKPRLRIKFSCKTTGSCEASKQLWINQNCAQNVSLNGNKDSMRKSTLLQNSLKLNGVDNIDDGSPVRRCSVKRGPSGVIDTVLNKRQKMDRNLKRYCGNILEALIKHPTSWGFCEPVDPGSRLSALMKEGEPRMTTPLHMICPQQFTLYTSAAHTNDFSAVNNSVSKRVSRARRFALVPLGPPLLSYGSRCKAMLTAVDDAVQLVVYRPYKAGDPIFVWHP